MARTRKVAPKATPKASEEHNSVRFLAKGQSGDGDSRFEIDGSSAAKYGDNDRAVVVCRTPSGQTFRFPVPRNVYSPEGADVGAVEFTVTATAVKAAPKAEAAAEGGVAALVLDKLIAKGDATVLAAWLAKAEGRSKPTKADTAAAELLVG
jgi:hypothetical protein